LTKKPKYILEDKCTGCTTCVENCPVTYPDVFNQQISRNKAIHIYFPQAIPLVAYIDESCIYLKEKKCRICTAVCKNDAIDFNQRPEHKEINIGAIILASGIEPFDPKLRAEYRYGEFRNVITSLDFERLLSSTGPYQGEVLRPSDGKHPKKIAWIQCVGSRQVLPGGNSYCSAVCCTYTQKQVILTKDHSPDAACTIFHNDIRSYGKDFERYFQKAENLPGVRFIRSYVSIGKEIPESGNVTIRYATADEVKEEEFEMVVLSVGLNPPTNAAGIAAKFGIELESHGFCMTDPVNPVETTRRGVFISGAFQGPVDIPESVFGASGAGSLVGELLNRRRGKLSKERVYPSERDASQEKPRIGVFVCHCGANIGRIVNVPSVVEYALGLPNVVYAREQLFSCATNSAQQITDLVKEKGLNRVVVAACSPRTLEPLFRDTLREAGINQYFFEMANIREHCSWVHSKEKEKATAKAKDIIRMSVARAGFLEPLREYDLPVNKAALVVGGGMAGMTCALSIANQGHEVYLLEKNSELGGMAQKVRYTLEGLDVQASVRDLVQKVHKHPLVHVYTDAVITEAKGYVGNFVTAVKSPRGPAVIKHGAAVIAIGAEMYRPTEYLYGQDDRVLTQLELEQKIADEDQSVLQSRSLAMIQCVGCRQEDRNYCSRICCAHAVKNALKFKEINPEADVHIYFRDMRTYGFKEDYYRLAAEKDIKFIRYEPEAKPLVEAAIEEGRPVLRITAPDPVLGLNLAIDADLLALSAAILPAAATNEIASLFKVPLSPDGFFKEAHVKLRPVDFGTDGVYLCGAAHYPKFLRESVSQAYGAAGRVLTLLSRDTVVASGSVAEVDEDRCVSCGACLSVCNYGAIEFRHTPKGRKAVVNPVLCKGDGVCNTKCATNAIQLKHFTDGELLSAIDAAMLEC
jgi:heterodisulfide reductase subunit A